MSISSPSEKPAEDVCADFFAQVDIIEQQIKTKDADGSTNKEEEQKRREDYDREKLAFTLIVQTLIKELKEMQQQLREQTAALSNEERVDRLTAIACALTQSMFNRHHDLYRFINRTPERRSDLEIAVHQIEQAAILFDRWAKHEEPYRRPSALIALQRAIGSLSAVEPTPIAPTPTRQAPEENEVTR